MIQELFASARLAPQGPTAWSMYIPNAGGRVYVLMRDGEVVYIGQDPHSETRRLQKPDSHQSKRLWAYWAATNDPSRAAAEMLRWFRRHFNQLPTANQK